MNSNRAQAAMARHMLEILDVAPSEEPKRPRLDDFEASVERLRYERDHAPRSSDRIAAANKLIEISSMSLEGIVGLAIVAGIRPRLLWAHLQERSLGLMHGPITPPDPKLPQNQILQSEDKVPFHIHEIKRQGQTPNNQRLISMIV